MKDAEFNRFFTQNRAKICGFIASKVSDYETAQDITQQAFIKFWRFSRREKVDNPKNLIYRVANGLIIDHYRKDKMDTSLETLAENGFDPAAKNSMRSEMEDDEEVSVVKEAIRKMPAKYGEILYLRYVDELSLKEIGFLYPNLKSNAICVRLNRGLKVLKEALNTHK